MNGRTTERLRDLSQAMGEQFGEHDLPPLRLDAAQDRMRAELRRPPDRRWNGARWLVPVLAGVAVLALMASLTAGARLLGRHARPQHPVKKPRHLEHFKVPHVAPLTGAPQFMVTWEDARRGYIRSVGTGRVIARIPNPARDFFVEGVAAAPGDRVFYLAGVVPASAGMELEFYRIVLSPKGLPGPARPVAGPPVKVPTPVSSDALTSVAVAVSLDGREFAFAPSIAMDGDHATRRATITVRNLVTGASHSWSVGPSPVTNITQLSWARDGQLAYVATLGYVADPHLKVSYDRNGGELNSIMVLDTTASGNDLLRDSVQATSSGSPEPPPGAPPAKGGPVAGVITYDGRTAISESRDFGGKAYAILAGTSVTTHVSRSVLSGHRGHQADPMALDGDNLLFTLIPVHQHPSARYVCGHLALGNLRTGRIRSLPFPLYCSTVAPTEPFLASW